MSDNPEFYTARHPHTAIFPHPDDVSVGTAFLTVWPAGATLGKSFPTYSPSSSHQGPEKALLLPPEDTR
jgi:hypothetical protein